MKMESIMRTALFLLLPALSMMIASALEIRSAKFGVGNKRADVTEPFKQLKANDDLYIGWIDGNRMAGRDPAPRIAKKLVVVYVDNDGTEKTAMPDERTINGVAANTPVSQEFQLGSAWFGDHGKYLNITEKMREIIASNREVTLDFPTLGIDVRDDPVPGKNKLVVLFYSIDGRQYCKQLWKKDKFKGSSISGAFDPIPEAKNARTPFRGMELDTAVWQWAMPVDGVISGENGLPPVAYLYIPRFAR